MSEELEHSLQQAIETYVNDRLRAIDEQLERLQREMSEGLAQLREQSAEQRLDGTAVSAAIFAHLQTARSERLTAAPTIASPSADTASLKRAVQDLESQQSQTDVLKELLRGTVRFADRVALFVIKNDQAIGWRLAKSSDPDLEMIGGVSLPLTAQTIVTRAVRSRTIASGADAADSDYAILLDQLGGAPAFVAAIPLVVRGKVVAVLYADSPSTDTSAMDLDALELLTRVASMAVNLVSIQRASAPAVAAESAPAPAAETGYTPQVEERTLEEEEESATDRQFTSPVEYSVEAPAEPAEAEALQPTAEAFDPQVGEAPPSSFASVSGVSSTGEQPWQAAPTDIAESTAPTEPLPAPEELSPSSSSFEPGFVTPAPTPEPQPMASDSGYSSSLSAPLGTSRRYGVSEPELPVEVSEDERRLHNDARRFARLLVSEIKLYNEPKVQEGRNKNDLYERLRDDIDRSRQMYDKRVAPPVAARHDYFHQELVNTLAEGDVTKLGMSYPGAAMSSN